MKDLTKECHDPNYILSNLLILKDEKIVKTENLDDKVKNILSIRYKKF